jgi:hypothetical protein
MPHVSCVGLTVTDSFNVTEQAASKGFHFDAITRASDPWGEENVIVAKDTTY